MTNPEAIGEIVSGSIPFLCGSLIALYGFQILPRSTEKVEAWAQWQDKWGRFARIGGPLVALFGFFQLASGVVTLLG